MSRQQPVRASRRRTASWVVLLLAAVASVHMAAPSSATFPGVNGRISFFAFAGSSGEIFTARPDGSDVRRLTRFGPSRYSQISDWSPDGEMIAFDSGGQGHGWQIYLMNADGSGITQLTRGPGHHNAPSWSPDATTIAIDADWGNGPDLQGIWTIPAGDPDGVTVDEATRVTAPPKHVDRDLEPKFSPDGTRIAFTRFKDFPETSAIFLIDADGTGLKRITPWRLNASDPDWSPDGRMLTIDSGDSLRVGTRSDMYVMRADGSDRERLTDNRRRRQGYPINAAANPVWSPDATTIMYSRYKPDRVVLKAMRADGTHKRVVLARPSFPNRVAWGTYP